MKKLLSFVLALCMVIFPIISVIAYEEDSEHTNQYYYDYDYDYNYDDDSHYYFEPEDFGHFATATIEELQAYYGEEYYEESIPEEIPCFDPPLPPAPVPPPRYNSSAVVVMDADTGLVLYGNEHHTQMYPASITKIMTALIVIEHVQDLNERIEFSHNAIWSIPRSSSHIAMDEGETLTVYQALFGLMLSSANEVSIALAEHVSGSVEAFAEKMNQRATDLGAKNTYFVNPSGLPDEGHVTTAYDMALIMREAVRHPLFVDIMSTRRFDIPPTERQDSIRSLLNTNRLIHPGSYFNEWVIGGKTGFTNLARHTLVTYAEHEGRRLIISTLDAEAGHNFRDTLALMSFGFSMPFEERRVFEAASYIRMVPVYQDINGSPLNMGHVALRAQEDLFFMLPADFDVRDLRYDLTIPERVAPPVQAGDVLGRVVVYVQNIRAGEVELTAQNMVLALPGTEVDEDPWAGGGEQLGLTSPVYPSTGYYPSLTVYPTNLWTNEYFQALILPVTIFVAMLAISLIAVLTSRKRRKRKVLLNRFVKYYGNYKYR
ncbi:MAG: D-alanyl-D-alanine carboxypeptidase [Defluviitaleaceae bacterium]|nr:D-alanyl-D-alanine carboxypeptidase [Defluviitaleaceae bacterium]